VTPPANCSISTYSVYGSTISGFTPSSSTLIASGLTSTSYSNTGLAASTTHYYVVEALDAAGSSTGSTQAAATTQGVTSGTEFVAIHSGGAAVSNSGGGDVSFVADEDFTGGGTAVSGNTITTAGVTNAAPAAVYQSERAGQFTYTIPGLVAGAQYSVLLHFAEFYWTAPGKRVFNVAINGTLVLSSFDIYALAGANKALVEQFSATANSGGQIIIAYSNGTADQPKASGIEIRGTSTTGCAALPAAPGGLTATASSSSAIGLSWSAVTPPSNCTISSYSVYGSTTSGFTPGASTLLASGVTSPSYSSTGLTASTTYYYVVEALDADGSSAASAQTSATTPPGSGEFIAIAAGGPAQSNSGGGDYSFVADEDFSGGGDNAVGSTTINLTQPGANAAPMAVYQHARAGTFTYTIPGLTAGTPHTVLLHFAETYFTATGGRVFNVAINGSPVLTNLDIYATVGANAALVEQFTTVANSSGDIVIAFTTGPADQPVVSGIEIR
jgi:hypothetical protein